MLVCGLVCGGREVVGPSRSQSLHLSTVNGCKECVETVREQACTQSMLARFK